MLEQELKNLLDDTKFWIEHKTYQPEEIAIRFKHRIVAIHCFSNGNGRHSRMMADIIIESIFRKEIFTWHTSNMVKADETRKLYIKALREVEEHLHLTDALNKAIWKVYYENPCSDLLGRVVGAKVKTGIYKITNINN